MNKFHVNVVDDDPVIRNSLELILHNAGMEVQTYASGEEFVASATFTEASCLVLDLRMPTMTGVGLMDWLKAHNIDIPVIILSGHGDVPAVVDTLRRGAIDFIEKPVSPAELIQKVGALQAIAEDRIIAKAKAQQLRDRFARLTAREMEVVDLLARGLSSKQIANEIGISIKTVDNHRSHLLAKTQAPNVASLVYMKTLYTQSRAA